MDALTRAKIRQLCDRFTDHTVDERFWRLAGYLCQELAIRRLTDYGSAELAHLDKEDAR